MSKLRILLVALLSLGTGYAAGSGEWSITAALAVAGGLIVLLPRGEQTPSTPHEEESVKSERPSSVLSDGASTALSSLEGAALLISGDERVVAANDEAFAVFGRHIVGENIRIALRHPAALQAVTEAAVQKAPVTRTLGRMGRGNASYRMRAYPEPTGTILVTMTDISAAEAAERMRADFVANASHELRTPLATLVGFIETLQGPAAEDAEARARFLNVMADESSRMTRLIDDLLSLSRIERDKNVRPRSLVDFRMLVTEFVEQSRLGNANGHAIKLDVGDGDMNAPADRDQILQVLHNLFSNAVKYGGSENPVEIELRRLENAVSITVRDHGEGVEPQHLPRLTERFYRVDTGRSQRLGGTGLGLAIVKHIVERHRGRLKIASRPSEGTSVGFILPVSLS